MTREEASYILRKFYADGYKSNNYSNLEQALQLAVECLENSPRWISVGDALPKEHEWILGFSLKRSYIDVYNFDSCGLIEAHDITHWMHLSPPPIITSSKKGGEE